MSTIAAIGAAAGAVNAGSGLIGSIANAVIAGQKLDIQKQALAAQIGFQAAETNFNYGKLKFDQEIAKQYLNLAQKQFETITDLNINGPARRASAMLDAGFRNDLRSNGLQLTYGEMLTAQKSVAERFYRPTFHTDQF
ncbi:minor protein [Vesivirus ferret badger/JX12/China/2012]|uniref:minor protein n=1 Tax=Vesivirus ferret badger/JX12/China/2012 TaxID=1615583 RepID=UPI00062AE013|nr:minor protein [Vesivirus ferret badger/JX12/China/2012]AJO15928.1 minor protein [Vesivirus ferret badger/JX12/China/2012]